MGTAVSKREYNYCFDFIKGIACICVVFMHCEFPGVLGTAIQCVSRFCVPFFSWFQDITVMMQRKTQLRRK